MGLPGFLTLSADGLLSGQPAAAGTYSFTIWTRDARGTAASRQYTLVIGQAAQTIAFGTLADKTYGDPDFTVNASASSGLPVSFSAAGACAVTGKTVHILGAGTCAITAQQPGGDNYRPAVDVARSFTVAPRPVTVTAEAKSKFFGTADPALTWLVSSGTLVDGDTVTGALARDPGENVGAYAIRQGTLALNANYSLTFVGATFTILPPRPDLIPTSCSGPSSGNLGRNISVSATVRNQGQIKASFAVTFVLSTDNVIDPSDVRIGSKNVKNLAAGATAAVSGRLQVPSTLTTGAYFIGVIADVAGLVPETNEENNTLAGNTITLR